MTCRRKTHLCSGFSLVEAVISVAIFGAIMILIFNAADIFFKVWKKQDAKQDSNREFVKIYNAINKDITQSNIGFFVSYNHNNGTGSELLRDKKWFCFPVPSDDGNKLNIDGDGKVIWTKVVIYYILKPDDNCNDDTPTSIYCPHKKLIRTVYAFESPSALTTVNTPFDNLVKEIGKTLNLPSQNFPSIDGLIFVGSKQLSDGILDFNVACNQATGKIEFKVDALRLEDAKKIVKVGTFDFNKAGPHKLTESIGWTNFIETNEEHNFF